MNSHPLSNLPTSPTSRLRSSMSISSHASHRSMGSTSSQRGTPTRGARFAPSVGSESGTDGKGGILEGRGDLRQWCSNSIEWIVRDVSALRQQELDHLSAEDDNPRDKEVLQAIVAEGKFRLDIVLSRDPATDLPGESALDDPPSPSPTPTTTITTSSTQPTLPSTPAPTSTTTLHLYLALLDAERITPDFPLPISIFIGIKPFEPVVGRRAGWVWKVEEEWGFHSEAEYWHCSLPPLSTLLQNPLILSQDTFTLHLHLQLPHAPPTSSHPLHLHSGLQLMPTELVDGLVSSLDNRDTGDVKFVCLEYGGEGDLRGKGSGEDVTGTGMGTGTGTGKLRRTRSGSRSTEGSTVQDVVVYRKRILYAHSDILRARSEYFRDLLDFQESTTVPHRPTQRLGSSSSASKDRKVHTIHCHETDFQTLYWTLHWIYSNELDFSADDDIREVVKRNHTGSNLKARRLIGGNGVMPLPDEWEWHRSGSGLGGGGGSSATPSVEGHEHDGDDVRTMRSGMSASSAGTPSLMHSSLQSLRDVAVGGMPVVGGAGREGVSRVGMGSSIPKPRGAIGSTATRPASGDIKSTGTPKSFSRTPITPASTSRIPARIPPSSASPSTNKVSPTSAATRSYPLHYPSPSSTTSRPKDPHPHPTPAPSPASSFAIYALAHRYRLTGLQELAQTHLTEKLTPGTACSLLLASYKYEELHGQTQEYVVENWAAIQEENAFLSAIQEVSNGLWGSDGGFVLHSLFKQLHT